MARLHGKTKTYNEKSKITSEYIKLKIKYVSFTTKTQCKQNT